MNETKRRAPASAAIPFTARPDLGTRVAILVMSLIFGGAGFAVFFTSPSPQETARNTSAVGNQIIPEIILAVIFGSFVLGCVAVFAWLSLVKIEASETGVRWRDFRGWHRADWDEIADFFAGDNSSRASPSFWLTTRDGRKVALERSWTNRELLQKEVIRRVGERLDLREWAVRGTRDIDLPRTLGYAPSANRQACLSSLFPAAMMACLCCATMLLPGKPDERITIDSPFFLILFSVSVPSMLGMGLYAGRDMLVPKDRLRELFTARVNGFVFDDGREATFVPWESVTGFDLKPPRTSRRWALTSLPRQIRTDRGQEFLFYASLKNLSHWETIVRRCAINGIESKVDGERIEALGGIAARWSGGVEGQGDRVFRAWTRSSRSVFVWLPAAFAFILVSHPLMSFFLNQQPIHPLIFVLFIALVLAILTSGLSAKNIRVQIGKDAISYLRPWKRETMAWDEIERVEHEGRTTTLYRADGTRLRFDASMLAYGSQIAPLIDERLRDARTGAAAGNHPRADVSDR